VKRRHGLVAGVSEMTIHRTEEVVARKAVLVEGVTV
jgi:hypothetical protein